MDRTAILERLRANQPELSGLGVAHAALFGSRARGEARADSDIDILVELAPEARIGILDYVGIVQFLEELFPARVDVANRAGLKAHVRPEAEREAIRAF